ncbi:hypothetical protein CL652_02590 [bacterium]|nr:hypothetical protein [bacterium]
MSVQSQKFFLYVRKSTDEAERQVLSIEAQLFELREYAKKEGLHIIGEYIESKTAKEPGREVFNEMLAGIEDGKACGVVAWHADRLARNSIDGGRIIYLLDTGKLESLKFPTLWFENTPQGKFMLSIAFGQSKYYVDNLSENIKRGVRQKLRNGIWPGYAPLGYLNDKNKRCIVVDKEKAPLIRKTFELYASGEHSLSGLREIINALGLVGKKGGVLSVSNFQYLLKNPIYFGMIRYNGELYEGKHEPIISKRLFDRAQMVMKQKSKPKTKQLKPYLYRGLFHCGECGCFITTETQKGHNYLRCTKRKGNCTERYTREEIVSKQIKDVIQTVALPDEWTDWLIAENRKDKEKSDHSSAALIGKLEGEITEIDSKLETLLDMTIGGHLSQDEYASKKAALLTQKTDFKEKLATFRDQSHNRFELTESFIKELNQAEKITASGNLEANRDFLKKIGSNPTLAARTLRVPLQKPFTLAFMHKSAALTALASGPKSLFYSKLRATRVKYPVLQAP